MKLFRRICRIFLKCLIGIGCFLAVYLIVMFVLSRIPVNVVDNDPSDEIAIYIKTNGVHTDIVLPLKSEIVDWSQKTQLKDIRSNDTIMNWVAFGWGDRDFYLNTPEWSDLKVKTAFNALFYRGTGLMHVTFYKQLTESERCIKINISQAEYRRLVLFINSSFIIKDDGPIQIADASYGDFDSFYEATGKYNLFHTCNSWTNNALKSSGQKAAVWSLTDTGIFFHYQ